ncbi:MULTISPECIES: hypothetical protein [Cyanophyceae]|jgi:hypothetical protein|uniref:Uncharacterized protein n=1 Tax=Phormidium tenue FACHB-1050 TaxID=2692857 RepID=A0ABR8C9D9_9CYAN|nr:MULTISPECIES: hypothetical protein [Cyanophyceae]MBD2316321.1 hypothetical protein [Phormidium tenue FACHB-1050]OYQ62325.1 hypothetical protein B9G53_22790 [Pseudanabaena sp. SR411]BBC26791.1 hypothetical protein ABRG53_b078 [Pseudanabaena sp. ABRG5-3]
MSETAIASLMKVPEEINPLLEILWEIEQYQQQGSQLIELSAIGIEDFSEVTTQSQTQSLSIQRTLDNLKRASPIAAPMTIRGF